jgi:FkbM family methyltransferase
MNTHPQHPIFQRFCRWEGEVPPGYNANWLGVLTNTCFANWNESPRGIVCPPYPGFDEEYFEWIDVLESVARAGRHFCMVELGAGWGRWLVNAAAALQQLGVPSCVLVGIEADPDHYKWMEQHFETNNVPRAARRLVESAVAPRDGRVFFSAQNAQRCYGQAMVGEVHTVFGRGWLRSLFARATGRPPRAGVREVRAVSLGSVLEPLESVDLLDLDIQGAELDVLSSAPKLLSQKVKRLHIGTHSPAIEAGLRTLFRSLGFENRNDYGFNTEGETPYGKIRFADGVQTWLNPRFSAPRDTFEQ